jgi:cytochrome c biogenesis protein
MEEQMAQNARTRLIARPPVQARSAGGMTLTIDAVGEQLWGLLTSMRFVLVVILGLALLVLAGTLIMQAPAGVAGNPDAMAEWVGQVRPRYGGWTPVLETLQLFTAFTSVWFKILMTALSISLVACSIHRVRGLWRTAARPRVDVGDRFFEHAPQREAILARQAPAQAVASLRGALRQHRYRLLVAEDEDGLHAYADRNRWAPMGSLIGHLSLLFIVAGAIIGTSFGFRDTSFIVAEGATVPVPADGLSLQLVSFKDAYDPVTGMPADYASDVILYRGGERVARQVVRVNEPLRYDGVSFYQSFFGAAAVVRVTDSSGAVLHAGGVPLAWSTNDDSRRVGTFTLSGSGLTVWVVESAGTDDPLIQPGQVRLEVYETSGDGQPIALQTIDQGQPTTLAGLDFTFERESAYTGLSVARDPGAPLVWLGALMLIGGFSVVLVFPNRRVWFRITARRGGSAVALASVGRQDSGLGRDFTDLVTDLRRALQAPAKS